MHPESTHFMARERIASFRREAEQNRLRRPASVRGAQPVRAAIELRIAQCRDELERLAALSERRLRDGDWIVADVDGVAVAAVSVEDGSTVYDPFRSTAQAVSLLKLRRKQVLATA
ncbi:MAG TPA: hypothetical protein VGH79_09490 [Gaiellaceae bacterium]|jgi:glutathione S-transferase